MKTMAKDFIEEGIELDRQNQFPQEYFREQQAKKYPWLYGESEE